MKKILIFITSLFIFSSCEDPVTVDLLESANFITIDALLNDLDEDQKIVITRSGGFLDGNPITRIEDANVMVKGDDGSEYIFNDAGNGDYILPSEEVNFKTKINYSLFVELGSETFTASSTQRRVPKIDSIVWTKESIAPFGIDVDSLIFAQFYATDLAGVGDRYLVRGFRNDSLINEDDFNRAWDASPGPGIEFDNLVYALPIRQVITPNGTEFGEIIEIGDKVTVKLFSISDGLADFFGILLEQIDNGGLFATPPAILPTNLTKLSDGSDGFGWFEVMNGVEASATITANEGNVEF